MIGTWKDGITTATNLCVVGATGRFGRSIISQTDSEIRISGAVCSDSNPLVGKNLREAGIQESDTRISGASEIETAVAGSDVVLFVSKPDADLVNIPKVVALKKRIVLGTTGFTTTQMEQLNSLLTQRAEHRCIKFLSRCKHTFPDRTARLSFQQALRLQYRGRTS